MSIITTEQLRAARHALRLSINEVANLSQVSVRTIKRIEAGMGIPKCTNANLTSIKSALESAGIEFIGTPDDAPGIRIHSQRKQEP